MVVKEFLEAIGSFLSWLKSPKNWLGVLIFCATLLLVPSDWLRRIGLLDLVGKYRPWLAVGALFSAAILAAEFMAAAWNFITGRYRSWGALRASRKYLHELSAAERGALKFYIVNDTETHYFDLGDGVVASLVAKGLLYKASTVGHLVTGFAINIQPWVRHDLLKNPSLLEGAVRPSTAIKRLLGPWS